MPHLCILLLSLAFAGDHPAITHRLSSDQTHHKFSRDIKPVLRVPSGAVIEVFTEEATDAQLNANSNAEDMAKLSFDPIHPLTGPVYVEGAMPGDVLAVTLHKIELGSWGWAGIFPGFGLLPDEFTRPYLKTFRFEKGATHALFNDKIRIPLKPFPGVMGVAPDTSEALSTIPPRANGGNMDSPHLVQGTRVYLPVFVAGGLFSIGDTHAAQGMGEVCGTAIEAPMRIVYQIELIKNKKMAEPQYETDDYYAVTAFAPTLDEATQKAVRFMVDHLEANHGLTREEAYVVCSLAGDLMINEVVDLPNKHVSMHLPKSIFIR